jgi:hypothetical protein
MPKNAKTNPSKGTYKARRKELQNSIRPAPIAAAETPQPQPQLPLEDFLRKQSDIFYKDFSPHHLDAIKKYQYVIENGGRLCVVMPRGYGKTSLSIGMAKWSLLLKKKYFIVFITASNTTSGMFLQVFAEMGKALFGDKCYTADDTVYTPGFIIASRGTRSAIRGLAATIDGKRRRPDLVIIDDAQTDETAKNSVRVDELKNKIDRTILGLKGFDAISIIYNGTRIADDCLTTRIMNDKTFEQVYIPYVDEKGNVTWDAISQEFADNLRIQNPDTFWIEYQNQPENAMDVSRLLVFDKTKVVIRNYAAVPDLPAFIGMDVGLKNIHSIAIQDNTIIDARKTTIIGNVPATITALIVRYKQLLSKALFCVDTGWKTTELYAIARQDKAVFACKGLGLDTSRRPINEYRISPSIPYIDKNGLYYRTFGLENTPLIVHDANLLKYTALLQLNEGVISIADNISRSTRSELYSHLAAEQGVFQTGTYKKYIFSQVKNNPNHYLDAYALAVLGGHIRTTPSPVRV